MGTNNSTETSATGLPPRVELPALLTKAEVADYFGVSVRTVDEWRAHKRGPSAIKIGKHLRWTAASIVAFIERQEQDVA
ncbi:helix-turn-helix transcriptional regulator [Microbacterium xylanilyticum]